MPLTVAMMKEYNRYVKYTMPSGWLKDDETQITEADLKFSKRALAAFYGMGVLSSVSSAIVEPGTYFISISCGVTAGFVSGAAAEVIKDVPTEVQRDWMEWFVSWAPLNQGAKRGLSACYTGAAIANFVGAFLWKKTGGVIANGALFGFTGGYYLGAKVGQAVKPRFEGYFNKKSSDTSLSKMTFSSNLSDPLLDSDELPRVTIIDRLWPWPRSQQPVDAQVVSV